MPTGGPFDCYPLGWPYGSSPAPDAAQIVIHKSGYVGPSIAEQMGTDPISKLAAAIEKLADALKGDGGTEV